MFAKENVLIFLICFSKGVILMKSFKNYKKALLIATALCITSTISIGTMSKVSADTDESIPVRDSVIAEVVEVEKTDVDKEEHDEKELPETVLSNELEENELGVLVPSEEILESNDALSSPVSKSKNQVTDENLSDGLVQDKFEEKVTKKFRAAFKAELNEASKMEAKYDDDAEDKEENLGFFQDENGNTKYRDPVTREVFPGGVLSIEEDGEEVDYVFDTNGNLAKEDFVRLEDGSLVYTTTYGELLKEVGLVFIGNERYIFKEDHTVLLDDWYELNNGKLVYAAANTGKLYRNGVFTLKDGVRYVFNAEGNLAKGEWVDELGYGRAYGRPSDGVAYSQGAYTVSDGNRYVFNKYGVLAKGGWVDEPGYGRAYGRPSDGLAYKLGAFTVDDGKRYVFNRYGYLAKGEWVNEPGYGRAYGRPDDGVAYSSGAYTAKDGYRYAFDRYGYLAKGKWVNEPGYGRTYGAPETGRVYRQGAFNIIENGQKTLYLFNDLGYLSWGWIYEDGYGWSYAGADSKVFYNQSRQFGTDIYVFGPSGHLASGWVKDRISGNWMYGTNAKITKNNKERGKAYKNTGYKINGEWKAFDYKGYYIPRSWGAVNGKISENGTSNFIRINIDEQVMFCVRNGNLVMATPVVTGDVERYMQTPRGRFSVLSKAQNAVLSGPGYVSHVKYWMPFTNVGHGIHDANNWRQRYGNKEYIRSGSHGCVNTPRNALDVMYKHVYVGMPIFIH